MNLHAVNWVEIPVTDFDRAKKFYSELFQFEMPVMDMHGSQMGFLLFDMQKGGIGAAIVKGAEYSPSSSGCKVYLNGGDDLNVILNRVEAAGGKVLEPKTEVSKEVGFFAGFMDTEGNHIYLHSRA
jgi:predicted enzyme related to lactoylglutathione lyase